MDTEPGSTGFASLGLCDEWGGGVLNGDAAVVAGDLVVLHQPGSASLSHLNAAPGGPGQRNEAVSNPAAETVSSLHLPQTSLQKNQNFEAKHNPQVLT